MKAGTLNLPDSDFKMKGFWKFVNPDTIFSLLIEALKKNLETEYLKYLDHLKCKVTKKTLMRSKPNNTPPHPPPKLDMGGEQGI